MTIYVSDMTWLQDGIKMMEWWVKWWVKLRYLGYLCGRLTCITVESAIKCHFPRFAPFSLCVVWHDFCSTVMNHSADCIIPACSFLSDLFTIVISQTYQASGISQGDSGEMGGEQVTTTEIQNFNYWQDRLYLHSTITLHLPSRQPCLY